MTTLICVDPKRVHEIWPHVAGTQTQKSLTDPYGPASGALTGILGGINGLVGSAGAPTAAQTGAITPTANGQPGRVEAHRVRAKRGPMTGSGVTRYLSDS